MIYPHLMYRMVGFDSTGMIIILVAAAIAMFAQFRVQSVYQKYKQIPAQTNLSGAEVARKILEANGIHDVQVVPGQGAELSDFYDPRKKIVSLSSNIYNTNSIAAVSVAAHEVGHAIQHATNYSFIALRNQLLPMAIISSNMSMIILMVGAMMINTSMGMTMFLVGVVMYAIVGLFQLVTLPVEFNASSRALNQLQGLGIIPNEDLDDSKKMLNAAAFTYVAAFLGTILNILRFVLMALGNRRNR